MHDAAFAASSASTESANLSVSWFELPKENKENDDEENVSPQTDEKKKTPKA